MLKVSIVIFSTKKRKEKKKVSIVIAKFLCILPISYISIVIGLDVKLRNARSFCLVREIRLSLASHFS